MDHGYLPIEAKILESSTSGRATRLWPWRQVYNPFATNPYGNCAAYHLLASNRTMAPMRIRPTFMPPRVAILQRANLILSQR